MKKGDIIKFGNYPQDINGSKSPIEWLALDVNENEALLVSRYGLDCKEYHNVFTDITWEDCDLRKWLNNDFIKLAFSEEEEITQRIAYSVSALMKLNIISEVITTDNANLLPMLENKVHMFTMTVVSSGFDQRCATHVSTVGALLLHGNSIRTDINAVRPALRIETTFP